MSLLPSKAENGKLDVLVVEDNPVNRKVAVRMLEKLGCTASIAEDGSEGVQAWLAQDFDLILMDIQMPVMDGMQATRVIRAIEAGEPAEAHGFASPVRPITGHTPILAITAHALAGDRAKCLASGMDAYLSKPVSFANFASTIKEFRDAVLEPAMG